MSLNDVSSVDYSDPSITDAFKSITDEKNPINWVICSFKDNGTSTALELLYSGTGGYTELKQKLKMNNTINGLVVFGCLLVTAIDHRGSAVTSKRSRFVAFSYVGSAVSELLKSKASFQKSAVLAKLFPSTQLTLEINAKNLADMTELSIAKRLHEGSSAHKPTHYQFGDSNSREIPVEEIFKGDSDSDQEFDD